MLFFYKKNNYLTSMKTIVNYDVKYGCPLQGHHINNRNKEDKEVLNDKSQSNERYFSLLRIAGMVLCCTNPVVKGVDQSDCKKKSVLPWSVYKRL